MKNITTNFVKVAAVAVALFGFTLNAGATSTWTPPTAAAPLGNVDAPVNVGDTSQTKTGFLTINNTTSTGAAAGFINFGKSTLRGHVDIGPLDSSYVDGCSGSSSCAWNVPNFADAKNSSPMASIFRSLATVLKPAVAYATGTPSTDVLHVNGNASVTGELMVGGHLVCTAGSTTTGCGGSTSQWTTSGSNIYRPSGLVGIGTSTPSALLSLYSTAGTASLSLQSVSASRFWITQNATANTLAIGGNGATAPATGAINVSSDGTVAIPATTTAAGTILTGNNGGSLELGTAGTSSSTPFIDFHGNGGASSDYNARIINDGNGVLKFQNAQGTQAQVTNTSQSFIVANSPDVYQITSTSCNAAGPNPSEAGLIYFGSTLQPGTLTTYHYCKISGSFIAQQRVGYLLPPPPAAAAMSTSGSPAISSPSTAGGNVCSSPSDVNIFAYVAGTTVTSGHIYVSSGGSSVYSVAASVNTSSGAVSTWQHLNAGTTYTIYITATTSAGTLTSSTLTYTHTCT